MNLEWIKQYGLDHAPSIDAGIAITSDHDGNFYITGTTNTTQTGVDIFLIKYSSSGDSLWCSIYARDSLGSFDYPIGIALDLDGNIFIAGVSSTTTTYDDYILIKYNSDGQLEWEQFYNGIANYYDQPSDITTDIDGNVYVTGRSFSNATWFDILTIKYHSDGNVAWIRRYNNLPVNGNDEASSIFVDQSLNVYIAGGSEGLNTNKDFIILKYDSLGELKRITRYDADHRWDFAFDITLDNSGNVYVTGVSDSLNNDGDFLTIKYDTAGNTLWTARYNGLGNKADEAIAILVDTSGNAYITGYSYGGLSTHNDIVTIKYNSTGNLQWIDRYDGGKSSGDYPKDIKRDMYGNIYVCGSSYQGGYWNFPDEYTIIKYSNTGNRLWVKNYDHTSTQGECFAMTLDIIGNICVTGWIEDTLMNSNSVNIKFTPLGDIEWVKSYDGVGCSGEGFSDMTIDKEGKIYLVGSTYSRNSRHDYLILKFNSRGEIENVFTYDGPAHSTDIPTKIALDKNGNIYVTGRSVGNNGSEDITTIKINNFGIEWVQRYDGTANKNDEGKGIIVDHIGNVYVTGLSYESANNIDIVTIKYDSQGTQKWIAKYNGTGINDADVPTSIAVDYEGNVYITGRSYNNVSKDDYVTIKYYSDGTEAWSKQYNYLDYGDTPTDILVDDNKNVIVTGFSGEEGEVPTSVNIKFLENKQTVTVDYLTIKYDSLGNELWISRYNHLGSIDNRPVDMVMDNQYNVYITGMCVGTNTSRDYLTVKYDKNGNLVWAKTYDGKNNSDQAFSLTLDNYNNVYVTGTSFMPDNESYDIVTIKYTSDGILESNALYASNIYRSHDYGLVIKTTKPGEIYIGGSSGFSQSSVINLLKYNQNKTLPIVAQTG